MSDRWTDRLSEYLDGELAPEERAALEAHVAGCAECTATLDDLRGVMSRATALPDRAPESDLWPGIAARLRPRAELETDVIEMAERRRPAGRRFAFTVPQLAAAAVVLMLLTGTAVWALVNGFRGSAAPVAVAPAAPVGTVLGSVRFAGYNETVRNLERELEARRPQLDSVTVRVVEENLKIIDRAIADAQAALAADPSSAYLSTSLARAMQQKVDLLRRATALAGATS